MLHVNLSIWYVMQSRSFDICYLFLGCVCRFSGVLESLERMVVNTNIPDTSEDGALRWSAACALMPRVIAACDVSHVT